VGAGGQGTHVSPGAALSWEVGIRAVGTRGAPRAALHGPGASLSREVGTGATGTRGAHRATVHKDAGGGASPEPGGRPGHVAPPKLARAGLLLVVSGDFFLVASYYPTKNSRFLKKKCRYSSAFSPLPLLLLSRRCHGFFFDFFRPCPSVAMSGALQWHQLS
jgi:hypothetical protein